ncbi:MAG: COG1361 S-layer family protein, partial [Candidatus Micrarchaeota archaeon]
MTVRNERLDLTFIQNSDVVTKKESTLSMTIRNDGAETLKDVRLAFADSVLRIKGSGELKFGDLAPGQSATASATVFAELPPGVNLVDGQLSWIEKDVQKEGTRQVPITITSDADVGVYLEAKPLPLMVGGDHTISVLVSNLGSYNIENVDVKIESPALRSKDISDTQYIGGLQNDDFSTVQFQMAVNATESGTYPIDMTVRYRDQSGEWKSQVIRQSISVYGMQASQDSPLPLVLAVLVIAGAVWYFKFRKAKA